MMHPGGFCTEGGFCTVPEQPFSRGSLCKCYIQKVVYPFRYTTFFGLGVSDTGMTAWCTGACNGTLQNGRF